MPDPLPYLGWNGAEARLGRSVLSAEPAVRIPPPWSGGSIRDCSHAPGAGLVGMIARDPGRGGEALVVFPVRGDGSPDVRLRADVLLHHALAPDGRAACYTRPAGEPGVADLWLHRADGGEAERLLEGAAAHGSQPVWHPGGDRILFHTPDGRIESVGVDGSGRERLAEGTDPAVSPDGERIAFVRDGEVWLRDASGAAERLELHRGLLGRDLADGLSWSADGSRLSYGTAAGLVGKETAFRVVEVATGRSRKCAVRHLAALRLVPSLDGG